MPCIAMGSDSANIEQNSYFLQISYNLRIKGHQPLIAHVWQTEYLVDV